MHYAISQYLGNNYFIIYLYSYHSKTVWLSFKNIGKQTTLPPLTSIGWRHFLKYFILHKKASNTGFEGK